MSAWQRWLHHPESLWARKCVFHVHTWLGVAAGLYVLMMSVSGSVIVYRNQLSSGLARKTSPLSATSLPSESEGLEDRAEGPYPRDRAVKRLGASSGNQAGATVSVHAIRIRRISGSYAEVASDTSDTSDAYDSPVSRAIEWIVDLHENLLSGTTGRVVNGFGAMCLTLLFLTGAVIWWPGIAHWRRSISVNWKMPFARVSWDIHSAVGFWCFLFIVIWGISGMYFCFPNAFNALSGFLDFSSSPGKLGFGDRLLGWLTNLHFGRFNGLSQAIWASVGLVPAVLSFTGVFLYCHRIIHHKSASPAHEHDTAVPPIALK